MPCQYSQTLRAASSLIEILMSVPDTLNGRDPACQNRPLSHGPVLVTNCVKLASGRFDLNAALASANAAHVVGTDIPASARTSSR